MFSLSELMFFLHMNFQGCEIFNKCLSKKKPKKPQLSQTGMVSVVFFSTHR